MDKGFPYNQEAWFEELLDDKGAFYDGSKNVDSGNDDDNYTKTRKTFVCRIRLQALRATTLLKNDSDTDAFL